jgi:hypothetical protein
VSVGRWVPEVQLVQVLVPKGKNWQVLGFQRIGLRDNRRIWLFIEEALCMVERGSLEVLYQNVPLSVQEMVSLMISSPQGAADDMPSKMPRAPQCASAAAVRSNPKCDEALRRYLCTHHLRAPGLATPFESYSCYVTFRRMGYIIMRTDQLAPGYFLQESVGQKRYGCLSSFFLFLVFSTTHRGSLLWSCFAAAVCVRKRDALAEDAALRVVPNKRQKQRTRVLQECAPVHSLEQKLVYSKLPVVPRASDDIKTKDDQLATPHIDSFYVWRPAHVAGFAKTKPSVPDFVVLICREATGQAGTTQLPGPPCFCWSLLADSMRLFAPIPIRICSVQHTKVLFYNFNTVSVPDITKKHPCSVQPTSVHAATLSGVSPAAAASSSSSK